MYFSLCFLSVTCTHTDTPADTFRHLSVTKCLQSSQVHTNKHWYRILTTTHISVPACSRPPSPQTCGPLAWRHVVIHSLFQTRCCVKLCAPLSTQPVSINQASFRSKLILTPGFCQCVCLLLTADSVCFCSFECSWNVQCCGYTMNWVYDLTCKPNFHIYKRTPSVMRCQCHIPIRSNHWELWECVWYICLALCVCMCLLRVYKYP